ncbi:MAG: HNH endonuclease signature motif containing protein [Candidatus Zixiibacteriota bacterium]
MACAECIEARYSRLAKLRNKKKLLENPSDPHIVLRMLSAAAISLATMAFLHPGFGIIVAFLAFLFAKGASEEKCRKLRGLAESDIRQIVAEIAKIDGGLDQVFSEFVDYPPDWEERRRRVFQRAGNRCEECGRSAERSSVPFHVHHDKPRSQKEGNHRIENLRLLCEVCHAKLPDHGLTASARSRRLKTGERLKRRFRGFR